MNRIKLGPLAQTQQLEKNHQEQNQQVDPQARLAHDWKIASEFLEDRLSLFIPLHYEKNYAYPLIIWLHDDAGRADQVQQVLPATSLRNYVGIGVQSPQGNDSSGFRWDQDWKTIDLAQHSIEAAIDQASVRCNINPSRIFRGGRGTGGTMALRLALARPELFAGVMSIDGPLPNDQTPLREWTRCRTLPIYWAHDRTSTHFSLQQLCRQLRLFHIAGFSVTLRQYPLAEMLDKDALSDMNHWMMEMIQTAILDR